MDSLTHVLFGATLAQTGFRRRLGRRATLAGVVIASIPDIDVAGAWVEGRFAEWEFHRGFTHSLLFALLCGPLIGWAMARVEAWRTHPPPGEATGAAERRRCWIWLSGLALLSHPLLDVFTSYGTQLLWPLTAQRFAVDAVAIVDPLYSLLPLLIALGIGARGRPATARVAAYAVFAYMALYLVFGWQLNGRIERVAAADFGKPAAIHAYPLLLQPFYRRVVAMTPDAAHTGYYSVLNPKPIAWQAYPIASNEAVAAVRKTWEGTLFQWFAMDQVLWRAVPDGNGDTLVEATDLRYGMLGATDIGNWGLRAEVDGNGVVSRPRAFSVPRDASRATLREFWAGLTGW